MIGIAALIWRLAGTSFRLLRRGVDAYLASETADTRAQRGDLTGMQEAVQVKRLARRRRAAALTWLAVWVALLILPASLHWTGWIYAACALLWLLPGAWTRARS